MSNRTTTKITLQCVDKSIDLNTDNTLMLPYCIITIEKLILFPILRNCCDLMLFHELKPNCIGPSNHWHNHYTIFKLKTNNQKRNTESPRKTTKISFYQNDKTFSITVMVCWFENLTLIYYCQMNHNYTLLGYPLTTMSMPHQYKWKQKTKSIITQWIWNTFGRWTYYSHQNCYH